MPPYHNEADTKMSVRPCAHTKKKLLERIVAKPFYSRSDVDVKLLTGLLRRSGFSAELSSASTDALARAVHFRVVHDGELLFREGDTIEEVSGKFLVVEGSLLLFVQRRGNEPQSDASSNRYGVCMGTRNAGSICGEDAITGAIVRKMTALAQATTLVTFVTQADYLRVAHFNVEDEINLLDDVRQLFTEPVAHSSVHFRLHSNAFGELQTLQTVKRFLHRYECFRMIPQEFALELTQRLQLHVCEPGDRLHPARDSVPRMFFMLSGECCVHVHENAEEIQLRRPITNQKGDSKVGSRMHSSVKTDCGGGSICCDEVHDSASGVLLSTHICTLSSGDAFGEMSILNSSPSIKRVSFENITLSIPQTNSDVCFVISLSIDDYFDARSHYLESNEFAASSAYSILSTKLPRDRTCEQLNYLATYFARYSTAKLFFGQLSPIILRQICLHATLEEYKAGTNACIQEQGKAVEWFRVVLDGKVSVFKAQNCSPEPYLANAQFTASDLPLKKGTSSTELLPTKSILQNSQHLLCSKFVEPLGVMGHGSAFGLLPVLLDSPSPFGYVAYASAVSTTTNILRVPASMAKICLGTSDEHLVCRPGRAIQQTIRSIRTTPRLQLSRGRKWQANKEFERLALHCPAVSGIPQTKLKTMISNMLVVTVPAQHFLFEAGETAKGSIFVVLDGNVRTYRCPVTECNKDAKLSNSSKAGAKEISGLLENVSIIDEDAGKTPQQTMFAFEKPVDDDFYTREYKYVNNFGVGDGFGRHGTMLDSRQPETSNISSSKLSSLVRRATSRRFQIRQQTTYFTVYPETAITTTKCRLGIMWSDNTSEEATQFDPMLTAMLISAMQDNDKDIDNNYTEQAKVTTLLARSRILEMMGLAKRLTTRELLNAAEALRYVEVGGGETVYKCGEEGVAVYFIVSGRVRIFNGRERGALQGKPHLLPGTDDFWSIELREGDVFGEDAFFAGISASTRRLTTALAVKKMDSSAPVKLLYLSRDAYAAVTSPWKWFSHKRDHSVSLSKKELSMVGTRSPIDRWKSAVFQVIRTRPTWSSAIRLSLEYRTELTFDMVHALPLFKDVRKQLCLEICKDCLVEVASQDSAVFERGDQLLGAMFLVITGSVTIQQQVSSPLVSSGAYPVSTTLAKVPIRLLKPGDSFGEAELILDASSHLIDAIVSSAGTKLLRVPKMIFFRLWPQRARQKAKLEVLKHAFDATSPLNSGQLASIYYAAEERSFKRNEVVFSSSTRGLLVVIETGTCVVHDYVTLQRKRSRNPQRYPLQSKNCPPKLALETTVASLGPSTILYSEEFDSLTITSSKRLLADMDNVNQAKEGEYTIADSPEVNTLCVQLYCISAEISGSLLSHRNQDLFVLALLGRGGLQRIRAAVSAQHNRRAERAANSIRLVEASAPKDKEAPLLSLPASPLKRVVQKTSDSPQKLNDCPMQMDLTRFLRNRQLPTSTLKSSKEKQSRQRSGFTPLVGPTMASKTLVTTPTCFTVGSFTKVPATATHENIFPALCPVGPSSRLQEAESEPYVDHAVVAGSLRSTQLIRESRVIAELSHQAHRKPLGPKLSATEKRQRHGRPPSRQLESRDRLVDILPPDTNVENDRKRAGLCRRLLHIKSDAGHK